MFPIKMKLSKKWIECFRNRRTKKGNREIRIERGEVIR